MPDTPDTSTANVEAIARHIADEGLPKTAAVIMALVAERDAIKAEMKETEEIAERDGYEEGVQHCDMLTGGDGDYYYSTMGDDCPDPATMKARMQQRYAALEAKAARADALEAEVQRLWVALSGIAHTFTENSHGGMQTLPATEYQRMARSALTPPAPEEPKA
ncbi:hypothetical protein K7H20_13985 [Salipiger manganoxidans]|uniref:hypothetical protein n=1 Tax=Salipiger marinus TaxID=555512 RepID=UPI001E3B88C3|nr:hypothetical protein [Salipiger manganoxidans]MCD1619176.1 hypothetical protein [Salipiger manganoxidans]